MMHRSQPGRNAGFSLAEFIMLLVIIGVLAVVAVPLFESRALEERGFFDDVTSAVRYARMVAISSNCPVQLSIPDPNSVPYSPNSYVLNQPAPDPSDSRPPGCTGAFTKPVVHAAGENPKGGTGGMKAVAPGVITLSMRFTDDGTTSTTVVFTPKGTLSDNRDRTVTVGTQGVDSKSITIFAVTGFALLPEGLR